MARTPFRAKVNVSTPYTIPVGKYAIFAAFMTTDTNQGSNVQIGSIVVAKLSGYSSSVEGAHSAKPLTASAGDVLTAPTNEYAVVGFLYDA